MKIQSLLNYHVMKTHSLLH